MSDPKSQDLLDQLLAGYGEAAAVIFDRYVQRLLALARTRIGAKLRRRVDPEDVVQSAFRSFFLHAQNDQYQLNRSGDLWRLLAGIVAHKLYGQIEKQTAARRDIHREAAPEIDLAAFATHEPTVADAIAVAEQWMLILNGLSADEQIVLTLTLDGRTPTEIAQKIKKSTRTVRRLLTQARNEFEKQLLERSSQPPRRRTSTSRQAIEPEAPLRFSNYVLERLLGSGGMGKVYRARDKVSGRTVAIKSLHKKRQRDDRAIARFLQESQILGKLRHPNIVRTEGLGRFPGGGYFIVMEFVDGADLQTRLESGPLPPEQAVSMVLQVALAVQHAHDRGIVHCDLKPSNVLIGKDGRVFVTDFGFACILTDFSSVNPPSVGGTLGYIAPELLNLDAQPTTLADVYAFGALLWTLVTGQVPRDGEQLRSEQPDLSDVATVCSRCLADDPSDRYQSVAELIVALNGLASLPAS
ncbi:MAG: protein kinase [Pirellulales bacterium]